MPIHELAATLALPIALSLIVAAYGKGEPPDRWNRIVRPEARSCREATRDRQKGAAGSELSPGIPMRKRAGGSAPVTSPPDK